MADPAADEYAQIETEVATMLGIDRLTTDPAERLKLGRGCALLVALRLADYRQRNGEPVDAISRNAVSRELESMISPPDTAKSEYDFGKLNDSEHTLVVKLLAKAAGRAEYRIEDDPDPAAVELMSQRRLSGTVAENLAKTSAALRDAHATNAAQRRELIERHKTIAALEEDRRKLQTAYADLEREADLRDELLREFRKYVPAAALDQPLPANVLRLRT